MADCPLGKRQRDLLARFGGLRRALVVGDKISESLVARGLLAQDPPLAGHRYGGMVRMTLAGLRALADEVEAGRVKLFNPEQYGGERDA